MKKIFFYGLFLIFIALSTDLQANILNGNWRWRADDGNLTTATFLGAENTPVAISSNNNIRLRFEQYNNIAFGTSRNCGLYYSTSPSSGFVQVTTNGSVNAFVLSPTTFYTDGTTGTDDLLTNSFSTTPTNSYGYSSTVTPNLSVGALSNIEIEYCIKPTSNIIPGTTYYFSVNGDTPTTCSLTYNLPPPVPISNWYIFSAFALISCFIGIKMYRLKRKAYQ